MANASRDQNDVPTLLGVSNVDGLTPVRVYADPVTHRLLVDLPGGSGSVTSINVSGGTTGLTFTGGPVTTTGTITISSGTLVIANGGTNSSTALSGSTIMVSNGTSIVQGSAGTTTTVLHGNAAGLPTYSAVVLTTDVSGILPVANGGTGSSAVSPAITVATTNQTPAITTGVAVFYMNATGGALTVTLPALAANTGTYVITKTDSSANTVTAVGTINGVVNMVLQFKNSSITLISDQTTSYHIQ